MAKKLLFLGYKDRAQHILESIKSRGWSVEHTSEPVTSLDAYDLVISYGYRYILKKSVLDTAQRPALNLHISFLPWNRGAHPLFWAMYDGTPAGVTIHEIDNGIDTGNICYQEKVDINPDEHTFESGYILLLEAIETLLTTHLDDVLNGNAPSLPQSGVGTLKRTRDLPPGFQWSDFIAPTISTLHKRSQANAIIVLANLMDAEGNLNDETESRLKMACRVLQSNPKAFLVPCGWDYRPDSNIRIADAMAKRAIGKYKIPSERIIVETTSRDTVGDAVFSLKNIALPHNWGDIIVVTSDYHVARTREIFSFVYGKPIDVIGAPTNAQSNISKTEEQSLRAFYGTFEGIVAGNHAAIYERLKSAHPFYNGQIHPAIS